MKYNAIQLKIEVLESEDGYFFDVRSLYDQFLKLTDRRQARGKRFELALVLVLVVLAKLAGEDNPFAGCSQARALPPRMTLKKLCWPAEPLEEVIDHETRYH